MTIDPAAATHIQSMDTTASRRRHDTIEASKQPRRLPVPPPPPTRRDGARKRDDEGRTGKGEARTTADITENVSKQPTETDDIPMTSPERARHKQYVQAE